MVENCQDDGDDCALLLQNRLDAELYQICVVRPADDGDDEDHRQALGHAHAAAAKSASKWQTHFEKNYFLFCFQTTRTVNIDLRYLWLSFWVLGLFWKINLTFSALYVYWFLWFYFGDQNHIHSLFQVLFVFFNIFVYCILIFFKELFCFWWCRKQNKSENQDLRNASPFITFYIATNSNFE